jgi:hypothetical protein
MLVPWLGGPIVKCPLIYNSFWGPLWSNAAHQALANQINQFTQDLLQSKFMNVLSQYGLLGGVGSGVFVRASFLPGVPSTLTVSSYESIIQQCINASAFPQPVNLQTNASAPVLMIYLDDQTVINGGGRQLNFPGAPDIGYHDSFVTSNGQPCPYAFMAYFSNVSSTTVVASHEFAEMVTDPLYNAWTPDHAFHEIGDYCEGNNSTITVSGRTWTVQTIWSDTDNACIAQSPNPLPHISPGPMAGAGVAGTQGGVRGFAQPDPGTPASHQRVLPLPALTFDVSTGTHSMDQREVHNYVRKMFYPATHSVFFSDLPGFLRTIGGLLEQITEAAPTPTPEPSAPAGESGRQPGVARPGTCKNCSQS